MAWTNEQLLAIKEKNKNIIVSAGAGSGKTAVLSERVVEHVKNGININEMLILTFTNAAAQEMKDRIRTNLIDNGLLEQANLIDVSYITTFDSFALSILKKYSYVLNLGKNISIIDNSVITLKKEEILNDIFERYYEEMDKLFLKLINDFCTKDDREIFDAILSFDKELNNKYDKKEYLESYINNFYNDENINRFINMYFDFLNQKINQIKLQIDNLSNYVENDYLISINKSLEKLLNANNYESIKFEVVNVKLPRLNNATEEAKLIKSNIKSIIDDLKDLTSYNSYEEILNSIYLTKDYVDVITKVLKELDEKIFEYKKNISLFEFHDIAVMAIDIIEKNSDIKLQLKNSFKEILIDEYQDTNDLQEKFISLIENNNQYMVGDIKQSIYRFRNANPLLFKSKYDSYSASDSGLKIDLNKNFRSRQEVVDAINLIFNLIMDDNLGGANYISEHQMIFGQDNYLNVNQDDYSMEILNYNFDKNDTNFTKTEIEIFTIAKDIKKKIDNNYTIMDKDSKKIRTVDYKDFCILIDRSKHFNLYKKIFEYLNIPITIMKDGTITDSIDLDIIKNIYNLIIYVKEGKKIDNSFKYSFMSISRSYLFEVDDNNILKTFVEGNYYNTEQYKIIKEICNVVDELSNKQILECIINKFDMYAKLNKIGNINEHIITLDYLLNITNDLEKLGYTYVDFYEYLVSVENKKIDINLSLNKDKSNSVKIMTIHTSKGLEYPIVYYSSLDEKFNIRELNEKFIYSSIYGFITPYIDNSVPKTSILKILLKNKYLEEEVSEKLRLFYVALTRAREKIIFVSSLSENVMAYKNNGVIDDYTRTNYRSFSDILCSIYNCIKKYIIDINVDDLELTNKYNYRKSINTEFMNGNKINVVENNIVSSKINEKKYSKQSNKLYSKDEKNNIELGLKMHNILENVDFNNPSFSDLSDYEIELLKKFLNTNIFKNARKIYKEYEFYYENGNELSHGIIDLLLEYDDYFNIIDYKFSNIDDESYTNQLVGYKKYIESITNKKVNIYLYSITTGILKEIKI